jgi:hypothetical protein
MVWVWLCQTCSTVSINLGELQFGGTVCIGRHSMQILVRRHKELSHTLIKAMQDSCVFVVFLFVERHSVMT